MTATLNGHALHLDYSTPMSLDYAAECNALDLETLNIAAPIGPQLLTEFYAAHPSQDSPGTVYPLTTGDKVIDNRLFISRAEFHRQAWQRSTAARAKQENLPITATVEPATDFGPESKWEEGAQRVIISLDGIEIERMLMFPAKGETLTDLINVHGYTN